MKKIGYGFLVHQIAENATKSQLLQQHINKWRKPRDCYIVITSQAGQGEMSTNRKMIKLRISWRCLWSNKESPFNASAGRYSGWRRYHRQ